MNEDDIVEWLQVCAESCDQIFSAEVFVEVHDFLESLGSAAADGLARKFRQVFSVE